MTQSQDEKHEAEADAQESDDRCSPRHPDRRQSRTPQKSRRDVRRPSHQTFAFDETITLWGLHGNGAGRITFSSERDGNC